MSTKHKTPQPKGKTQIPQPDLRLTITRQRSKQRKGQEANKNNHRRFAKDTVVKTHYVANSKTCSKRINSHPMK